MTIASVARVAEASLRVITDLQLPNGAYPRLVPYLAEQARESVATSRPLMRGLFVDHPHDEAAWAHPHEFLLGDDLLVNPVTEPGVTEWATYLPAGRWVDAWDGSRHDGGRVVTRATPRDVVPVYVRAEAWAGLGPLFEP